ncbi:AAA-like domain-containing protein [Spirulina sp. 06S082]|uniref:AAA-like domain-containing protein n=1 Tax=Spirulina sp. 06S082 TaxID=3110248 RepID=UPI002B1F4EDE|nr:AAA-like domain-containing protein [Spirulina sp. 06S082]MEA5472479.1 AAA-like domain-containing protein [Spirulina sp. 06S082]
MSRSIRVTQKWLPKVRTALRRNSYPSQRAFATDIGFARATVSKFFTGKQIDHLNFVEISEKLGLDWQEIGEIPPQLSDPSNPSTLKTSKIYIERPPIEETCYQEILKPGSLIRIKAPKQMGKTSLAIALRDRAAKDGYRTVHLSLKAIDRSALGDLEQFLRQFCNAVCLELSISQDTEDDWSDGIGSKSSCTNYFEKHFLSDSSSPLLLCLDDVDFIFSYPVAEEYLTLLRFWHERAKTRSLWKELRLIVVHSTEDYPTLNINHSPFNVGLPIELPPFTLEQVQQLADRHKVDRDRVQKLTAMVGGHPFLLQQALFHLKTHPESQLDDLLRDAPTAAGIYSNYLMELLQELKQHQELAQALKQVVQSQNSVRLETTISYKLNSIGLVKHQGNEVVVSCELYREYFRDRLSDSQ